MTDGRRFGLAAEAYGAYRPTYAPEYLDFLCAHLPRGAASSIVEVGAGTGKASVGLADTFERVHLIEPDAEMADVLGATVAGRGNCTVTVEPFEELRLEVKVDAVLAAQAWHWLAPESRLRRAISLLRPDGVVAVLNNRLVWGHDIELRATLDEVYTRVAPAVSERARHGPGALLADNAAATEEFVLSSLVGTPVIGCWARTEYVAVDDYLGLLSTESEHICLVATRRKALFEGLRGTLDPLGQVALRWITTLIVARRSSPTTQALP